MVICTFRFMRTLFIALTLLILIGNSFTLRSQDFHSDLDIDCDTAQLHLSDYLESLPHYEISMGKKKSLQTKDQKLKLAFYVALLHYPELHDKKMSLRLKSISSTMQAQPHPNFILKRKSQRAYKININDNPDYTGIYYRDLSFNALVGWLGHEFAHVLEYSKMNNRELLGFISSYVFDKRTMRKTERTADRETIKHGLGNQLLDGAHFFHRSKKVSKRYRKKNKKYYLSEEEIIADIKKNCD